MKIRYVVTGPGVEPTQDTDRGLAKGRIFDRVDEAVAYGREAARAVPSVIPVMVTEEVVLEEADVPMVQDRGMLVPDRGAIARMGRTRMMWNSQQINDADIAPPLPAAVVRSRLGSSA